MKRCLFIIITVLLFFLPLLTGKSFSPRSPLSIPTAFAQTQPTLAPSPTPSAGSWVQDPTVTFLGQTVSRAENFMDWTLVNYKWDYLDTALTNIWAAIRNIVYAMLILVILGAAFLIVISGGSNVGVLVFTRKFILALILITFSFAIARFLYEIADIFQVFFFHVASPNGVIIGKDIVNISFLNSAKDFVGYRLTGIAFDESAFISLLLIKLSAVTFYVIGCILTVRKIILWFFLVVSPLYPIIALYFPLRNTAKVWLIEFLRWLLYAPLFALFLSAIVIIWKNTSPTSPSSLGLNFNFGTPPAVYQTAISILVGGPGQQLSLTNSLNYPDTFIQFVVALLMLWVAILMPFILLQLFLDFLAKYEFGKAPMLGQLNNFQNRVINNGFSFFKKSTPPSPLPTGQFPAGEAREIPRENAAGQRESSINRMTTISSQRQEIKQPIEQRSYTQSSSSAEHLQTINQILQNNITNEAADNRQTTQVAQRPQTTIQFKPAILARTTTRLVSFPIPTMRDIVRFETARLQRTKESTQELQEVQETLEKIANPQVSTTAGE
ncbi:MAG: hypothetical protein ABSD69_03290, partial [Candidatus Levyibacteriota bacterium]